MAEREREAVRAAAEAKEAARRQLAAEGARGGDDGAGEQDAEQSPLPPQAQKGSGSWKTIAAGLAIVAGIAAAAIFGIGSGADSLSNNEIQQRQAAYETFVQTAPLQVQYVESKDVDKAIATMKLEEPQQKELREKVTRGQIQLAWITVWDTHAEDGDIVKLESLGAPPVEVLARNAPTTVAFPMPANGVVNVTGMVDGGGGITIAVKSGPAEVAMPSMRPGQQFGIPVSPMP